MLYSGLLMTKAVSGCAQYEWSYSWGHAKCHADYIACVEDTKSCLSLHVLQVANFALTTDMHRRTVELNKQVDECTKTLEQRYGAIQAGLTRCKDIGSCVMLLRSLSQCESILEHDATSVIYR